MLILKNVKKKFWDLKAVDNISFQIDDGEIVSLIGSNGAGKTTLVNLICGYLKPDEGTILFDDRDITQASAYNRIQWGWAAASRSSIFLKTCRCWTTSAPRSSPNTG